MPIIIIIGVVLLLFFFVFGNKNKADMSDFYKGGSSDGGVPNDGYGKPEITKNQANAIAEELRRELHSSFTSEKTVLDILSRLNEADYLLVFQSFGIRKRYSTSSIGSLFSGNSLNLTEWLSVEITGSNKAKLKALFPNIF